MPLLSSSASASSDFRRVYLHSVEFTKLENLSTRNQQEHRKIAHVWVGKVCKLRHDEENLTDESILLQQSKWQFVRNNLMQIVLYEIKEIMFLWYFKYNSSVSRHIYQIYAVHLFRLSSYINLNYLRNERTH